MKKGWEKKFLIELASISTGKWDANHATENGAYRFYTCAFDYLYCDTKRFAGEALILPGNGVNVGEVFYYDGEFDAYQRTYVISDIKILPRYLHYHMLLHWKSLGTKQQYGSATNFIKIGNFKEYVVEYPTFTEQQRIVAILDEAFAAIAKAKANAEKNLQNARELFESYLEGVFENGDWEIKVLGELCTLITKGSSPKWQGINYIDKPGVLFVTSENVGEGKMLLNERKYVEEKFNLKDKKSILQKGDVLTNIVGASIGRTAIYDIDDVANINQAVCILRCNPKLISNNYLMNLLNSPFLKQILHSNEVNTARANLSLGFFNKLAIPCPSINEQQTIVRQLDALRAETQKLEAVYQKKLEDLEELKKSILQKAFSGELTNIKMNVA